MCDKIMDPMSILKFIIGVKIERIFLRKLMFPHQSLL